MATKASRIALAGSNISSTGEVDADLLDNIDSAAFLSLDGNGRLGIGTSSPGAKLEILSDGSDNDGAEILLKHANNNTSDIISTIKFANNSGSPAMIQAGTTGANNSGYIDFFTDNTGSSSRVARMTPNGRVGIGTDDPGFKLDVEGTTRVTSMSSSPGSGAGLEIRYNTGGSWGGLLSYDRGGAGYQELRLEGSIIKLIESGEAAPTLTVNNSNVGIGTTSPGTKLHVYSSSGNTYAKLESNANNTRSALLPYAKKSDGSAITSFIGVVGDANKMEVATTTNDPIHFYTNNNPTNNGIFLKADGNVGIGDTNPLYKLTVDNGTSDGGIFRLRNEEVGLNVAVDGTTGSPNYTNASRTVTFNATRMDSGSSPKLRLGGQGGLEFAADANNVRMVINTSGNVGIGTDSPGAKLAIAGGSTGAVNFLEFHYDDPGGDLDGLGNEEILVNYKFTDQNANNTPQVQVAAELGNPGHTDAGMPSEGRGNYVVRTNDGEAGGLSDSLRVEWDGSVHMPQQPVALYYDVTANTSVAQSELIGFATASGFNRGITDSNSKTRFSVSAAGIYAVSFTVSGSLTTPNAGDGIRIIIKRNGSTYATADAYNIETVGTVAGQEYSFKDMLLVELGINHYIELQFDNVGGTVFNANYGNLNIWKVA